MTCSKSDTCANYEKQCDDCKRMSSPFDETPYYVGKKKQNVKFKIFFGSLTGTRADTKLNTWLKENPNARIINYQYQATDVGHSICIMYDQDTSIDNWVRLDDCPIGLFEFAGKLYTKVGHSNVVVHINTGRVEPLHHDILVRPVKSEDDNDG